MATDMVTAPSSMSSSNAAMTNVCGVANSDGAKTRLPALLTVTWLGESGVAVMVTGAVGRLSSWRRPMCSKPIPSKLLYRTSTSLII